MKNLNLLNFKWLLSYSHEKQSPQRFARYAAMLIMFLTLGVGQMWGWEMKNFNNPYIYFYNSQGWSKAAVIYGRGHDSGSYTKVANMSLVSNTSQLYFVYINDYWGDKGFNQIAVIEAEQTGSEWGTENERIENRYNDVNHTGIKWNLDMSDDYST